MRGCWVEMAERDRHLLEWNAFRDWAPCNVRKQRVLRFVRLTAHFAQDDKQKRDYAKLAQQRPIPRMTGEGARRSIV
jgi:hypothetical protein